ncbi:MULTISPECIES: hypothetical protein [Agathobaculum]|uniref:hypothetical protein n=1 Tax=Agathobaculum TaxID=2048137 RepID=UPI001D07BDCA|nr:hypothetical protein [Agathobaculum butyriciproducens]
MFEPAPDFNADDKGCAIAAKQFYERVLHYAYQYNVFSEHRIGVINNCCSYLENLHRDNKQKIWPKGSREPVEEFQNVFQLLIYAICDHGFLFDDIGYFRGSANVETPEKEWFRSPWQESVYQYRKFALAMRRRNYAHLELKALRSHLDEHANQDRNYGNSDWIAEEKVSSADEKDLIKDLINKPYRCKIEANALAKNFWMKSDEVKKLSRLLKAIHKDRLLKKIEPFIVFMVLSGKVSCDDVTDTASVKAMLKPNKKLFGTDKAAEDCALFAAIIKVFHGQGAQPTEINYLFDPYSLIGSLQYTYEIELSDADFVSLAHLCEKCFVEPRRKKELKKYNQPLHDTTIGEALIALFVVFEAQKYVSSDEKKPYGWNKAVQMLKAAQILDTGVGENASEIMQSLSERYAVEQYSFVWEVFWLITGYMPPPLFDWKPNFGGKSLLKEPFELYAVCDDNLNDTLNGVYDHFIKEWDSPRISPELRLDIAKVRRTFADVKKTEDFRHELLGKINFWALNTENVELECEIAEYCLQQYRKLSSDKESKLKNLQKYPKIMSYAMAEEAVKQLCADSYACVFRMLASLNQYLWPVT